MPFVMSLLGGIPAMLMRGLGSVWAFLSRLSPTQLALLVVTVTGVGFHIADQRHIRRVENHDLATSNALGKERLAHSADIARWKVGQDAATKLNKLTIARVAAEQGAISRKATNDYETQLADLRARFSRMRSGSPSSDKRPADGAGASQTGNPSGSPHGEAVPSPGPDLGYTAEVELQLNALIDWVSRQSKVDPNH